MSKRSIICAGIDTGKYKLDVALHGRPERLQVANTAEGHEELFVWLRQHRVKRVGIEATGGYEQTVVRRLRQGRDYSVRWAVPATLAPGTRKYCAVASDEAGNRSARTCTKMVAV